MNPQDLMNSVPKDNEVKKLKRFVEYLEKYAEEKGVISFGERQK